MQSAPWTNKLLIKTSLTIASFLFCYVSVDATEVPPPPVCPPPTDAHFDATIPVLDMSQYLNPDAKEQFVSDLYNALHEVGFFALVNTGVDVETLDKAYNSCYEFFALPYEVKMESNDPSNNGQRGYVPGESAKGQSKGDYKEFYHVGRETYPANLFFWKNIWPENYNLKDPICKLYTALEKAKANLEEAMAEALDQPSDLFTSMTKHGDILLRAIHYPQDPPKDRFWAAEHTDIDLYTILPRATADGLQVKNKHGEWTDIRVPANAFIVNAGDMLENISNGEFHSGLHRVVANTDGYERYSIVFFVHPRSSDRLDPLPSSIARTGGLRKYANATRLELLQERLVDLGLASYPMMKDLSESGLMDRLIEVGRASPKAMMKLAEAGLASEKVLEELKKEQ